MAGFAINSFAGSIPRLEHHLLSRGAAAKAVDCRLDSGALASWFEPAVLQTLTTGNEGAEVLLRRPDCTGWQQTAVPTEVRLPVGACTVDASIAEWNVAENFVLVTGPAQLPISFKWDESAATWDYYGPLQPPPVDAPPDFVSSTFSTHSKSVENRLYAYQVCNRLGQWSSLSPAAGALANEGDTLVFTLPSALTSYAHGIYGVRWYRSVASAGSSMPTIANTMQNAMDTFWIRVAEFTGLGNGFTLTDSGLLNENLYEGLEEDVVIAPLAELQGITAVASMRCFAGYAGKRLFFSENNTPGNWPHYLTLDDNICGIVESNGMLYVATDGHPYVVAALSDCESASCRQAVRLPEALPMAGCGPHAIVALPQGAAYVSHKGLVGIAGSSAPTIISQSLYSAEQWQRMAPKSMRLAVHAGKLFCFGQYGAFVLTLSGGSSAEWTLDNHTELSDRPLDVFTTRTGELILRTATELQQWNAGIKRRPHLWESPVLVAPAELNFGAGHVNLRGGAEQISVRFDGRTALDRAVLTSRQFRLPNWAVGTRWSFTLEGTAEVNLVSLATSMKELTA